MRDPTHLYTGEPSPRSYRAARIVSDMCQPPILGVLSFVMLSTLCGSAADIAVCMAVSILFSVVIPMSIIVFFARKFGNSDMDVVRREDRAMPLMIGTAAYAVGTGVLFLMDVPRIIWVLMLCYSVVTFSVYIISKWWKISVHAVGCIGPSMGLIFAFGWPGALLLLVYPLVCWSRYVLKKHTPAQLVCGGILGFVLTGLLFLILL